MLKAQYFRFDIPLLTIRLSDGVISSAEMAYCSDVIASCCRPAITADVTSPGTVNHFISPCETRHQHLFLTLYGHIKADRYTAIR